MDQHIVYVVTEDTVQHRLTGPMSYDDALTEFHRYDGRIYPRSNKRVTLDNHPVEASYFAVRSANDPNWPSTGRVTRLFYSHR